MVQINLDLSSPSIQIRVELIVLREYLSQMEAGIKAVCESYVKIEEKKHFNSSAESHEYSYIYDLAEDHIPRIIRIPYLVSIYTIYENSVTQLLKYAQKKERAPLALKDINANSLSSKFNKYMAHILGYEFKFDAKTIQALSEITKLRNCIAHANGNLLSLPNGKTDEIIDIANRRSGIIVNAQQLDIKYEYLIEAMDIVSTALNGLMDYMDSKYQVK
ncbi:Uncharacterised protein [BD1-7 clade bacterium]|uniref:RiboL-PSP-HEPN domain-containing protein n=1 Tax=BD1-7 clade bacterium TaxID=2029982 RepID=A0A5S9MVQ5_9GAMM|nr:Uncharacterised protein [BD1-7 clade bacterium]CAA0084604.1 Uncharacterised protein [BD1-7 clade bacterium]